MHRLIPRALLPVARSVPVARIPDFRLYSSSSDNRAVHGGALAPSSSPDKQQRAVHAAAKRSEINNKLAQLHPQLAKLTRQYLFLRPPWLVQPPPTSFDPAMDLRRLGKPKTPEERAERAAVKLWRRKEERARVLKYRERWQRRALKEEQEHKVDPRPSSEADQTRNTINNVHPYIAKLSQKYLYLTAPWIIQPPTLSFEPGIDLRRLGRPKTEDNVRERTAYEAWRKEEERARLQKFEMLANRFKVKEEKRMADEAELRRLRLAAYLLTHDPWYSPPSSLPEGEQP